MEVWYKVKWQKEVWHTTYVKADNYVEAMNKIVSGDFDANKDKIVGEEVQEDMLVELVTDIIFDEDTK